MFRHDAEVLFRGQLRLNSLWWYNKQNANSKITGGYAYCLLYPEG